MQNILVVDDDKDLLFALKLLLRRHGYNATTLADPSKVESVIDEVHPAIIILDINMGEWDGRDVCKSLKEKAAYQQIPIVLYSAVEEGASAMGGCKAELFLKKPLTAEILVGQLDGLIHV